MSHGPGIAIETMCRTGSRRRELPRPSCQYITAFANPLAGRGVMVSGAGRVGQRGAASPEFTGDLGAHRSQAFVAKGLTKREGDAPQRGR